MGFLLIFFPEETTTTSPLNKNKFSLPSNSFIKRTTNSTQLLSKAQSTIIICLLLILLTVLLFTLSAFEPPSSSVSLISSRKQLSLLSAESHLNYRQKSPNFALQGMGILYRRGTKAMSDLIVAHVVESLSVNELKLFLRVLQSSALISRSDLVFIFPSNSKFRNSNFNAAILEESDSFLKLIENVEETVYKRPGFLNSTASLEFDATPLVKWSKTEKETIEPPIWGRRNRSHLSEGNGNESTRLSYGSVVGFTVDELDQENSLSGFLDHVPMNLRRWASYTLLLARVKRNYKQIMLVDAKEIFLPGDPLSGVRNTSPESVWVYPVPIQSSNKHGRRNSEKTQLTRSKTMTPAIIMGGARGVRRLSNAMLNDIVRMSMQLRKKRKNTVTELRVFNQLVHNEFLLKNVKLIKSTEPITELSSLTGLSSEPGSNFAMFVRGNSSFVVDSTLMKKIMCARVLDSLFYIDCHWPKDI